MLGDPVAHSKSPTLHTAALVAAGLSGRYEPRCVDSVGLGRAFDQIRAGALDGASVTMPHKRLAAALSDRLSKQASRTEAVNTLVSVDNMVVGHNTDVVGVAAAWVEARLPTDRPILVLGAGGAAAAATLALEGNELYLSARRLGAAQRLLEMTGVDGRAAEWQLPVDGAVVVNATSIGMSGEALPVGVIDAASGFFEMVYAGGETPAMARAVQLHLPMATGLQMLLHQAAAAFELWTGHTADLAAMRAAISSE